VIPKIRRIWRNGKRRIHRRLDNNKRPKGGRPQFAARNIRYELGERCHGLGYGGLGAVEQMVKELRLAEAIDDNLHLLKVRVVYHESDHVLNLAYNALCDGTCLQDLELRRQDEVFLNALGATRLPDPTTAGDFCRRFTTPEHIRSLLDAINEARLKVWAKQPDRFFDEARLDGDGSLVETTGQCKEGMDIAYDGTWSYHPLIVSLANTKEVLSLINRSGNRPSHEGAAAEFDYAADLCFRGGFRRVLFRGDTDFSQTQHLDRWHDDGRIRFLFGYNAMRNVIDLAQNLPATAWKKLKRPAKYQVRTEPRSRPANVKDRIVREREYKTLRLQAEDVAEFRYRPHACRHEYRIIVVRKDILTTKGDQVLFDECRYRYFFYITNDFTTPADELVFLANDRCDQENLLAQLHGGVRALHAPVNALLSNWAYMVMTALAWNLKAWFALLLPETPGPHRSKYQKEKHWLLGLEFRTFVNYFIKLPCQLVRTSRFLVFRLVSWTPFQPILFRLLTALRH
jgi:Transposase DDE domain group 1